MKYFLLILTLSLLNLKLIGFPISESKIDPWGADSELVNYSQIVSHIYPNSNSSACLGIPAKSETDYLKGEKTKSEKHHQTLAQKSCKAMIRFFQVYISPIDGPRSSFYPTSSQYALEAIQKHGVLQGIGMGCDRLMRENAEMWVYQITDDYGMTRKLDPVK